MKLRALRRAELPLDTVALARFLVGVRLVRENDGQAELAGNQNDGQAELAGNQVEGGPLVARIVETEAYAPGDASSHAYGGLTRRNRSMFLRRGHAYVYLIYGTSYCLNVSSEHPGTGAAVLIRAGRPLAGCDEMRKRRGEVATRDLLRGPGRLAAALGIDRRHDGLDLCARGKLWLAMPDGTPAEVGASVRIGLSREAHRSLRFYERGSPFVSGPRRLNG